MGGVPTNWKRQVLDPGTKSGEERTVEGLYTSGEMAHVDIVVFSHAAASHINEINEVGMSINEAV